MLPVIPDQKLWAAMISVEEVELEILQNFEDGRRGPQKHLDALQGVVDLSVMNTTYAGNSSLEYILGRAEMEDFKDEPGEFQLLLQKVQKQFGHLEDELSMKLMEKVNGMRSGVRTL